MHFNIISGILLIVVIVDFALAAPVLVQEKCQACADSTNMPEYPVTVLAKRVNEIEEEEKGVEYVENWFSNTPKKRPDTRLSSISEPSGSNQGQVDAKQPQPPIPASSTTSDRDHEYQMVERPPPSEPPVSASPIPSDKELSEAHGPKSSPMLPTWFLTDHGYKGPNAPQPHIGPSDQALAVEEPPSRPGSPTLTDAGHGYQMVHPPSLSESPGSASTEFDYQMVDEPNPHRRSMGEDSRLRNLQSLSNTMEGNARKSRHRFGAARGFLNAAQRELQRA